MDGTPTPNQDAAVGSPTAGASPAATVPPPTIPPLSVAFSGGGFRATLFHLGVLLVLLRNRRISPDSRIVGVSGGAVLAGHLAHRWSDYVDTITPKFHENENLKKCIRELLAFVRMDVRHRIFRRVVFSIVLWVSVALLLFAGLYFYFRNGWTLWPTQLTLIAFAVLTLLAILLSLLRVAIPNGTKLLEREYDHGLFQPKKGLSRTTLEDVVPNVFITSTSLTTGELVVFGKQAVMIYDRTGAVEVDKPCNSYPLARSVCSSSAFPPAFAPVRLPEAVLGETGYRDHLLTDGGIHDNLGVTFLKANPPTNQIVISDAGRPFSVVNERGIRGTLRRNMRANDLLMYRVADFDIADIRKALPGAGIVPCRISPATPPHGRIDPGQQLTVASLRTDLDEFTDEEIFSLINHGAASAQAALSAQDVTPEEICALCELKQHPRTYIKNFDRSHRIAKASWWTTARSMLREARLIFIAFDWICLGWLIPLGLLALGAHYFYDQTRTQCPDELTWSYDNGALVDQTLSAISLDLVGDSEHYEAHLRRSNTLGEACGGRTPADFTLRVPAVRDGAAVVTSLAYLAIPKLGRVYSFERILKVDFNESATLFRVQNAPDSSRIYVLTRMPKSGLEGLSDEQKKSVRSDRFQEILGPITVTCP